MSLRKFASLFVILMGLALPAHAELVAGRDYQQLTPPLPTQSGKSIEVLEFFWYGCPHCNDLNPLIKQWLKTKPKDVDFRYVPTIFRDNWVAGAKTFHALEATGDLDRLHDKVYDAIHLENVNLTDEKVLFDWMAKQGVDRKKFEDAYRSFSMQTKVAQAQKAGKDYQLKGVPAIVVDGKYLTSGSFAGSPQGIIQNLDLLIEKARKERGGATPAAAPGKK